MANLGKTHIEGADLEKANLEEANFEGANLEGARNLSFDQLSKVKTLYNTKLDKELIILLNERYPALFKAP
jgi:uncharacterized protein YjbI with pentapeptide repeats